MLKLHGCTRCYGDLYLDDDEYVCLACGYRPRSLAPLPLSADAEREARGMRRLRKPLHHGNSF